jgi:site-specific recombinase XerD
MRAMVKTAPSSLIGLRNRALLLLGFAGALRRSELVGLNVSDLMETKGGLRLSIRVSKTDQERLGQVIAIAPGKVACPIKALRAWLAAAHVTEGPVFRSISKVGRVSDNRLSDRSVADIVKASANRVGIDPTKVSGHSLRAGFLTSAARHGASIFRMMDVSRHKSMDTLRGYVRDSELFRDHPGAEML